MRAIAVFCSSHDLDPAFHKAATLFAEGLALRQQTLIYGGSKVGLMGYLADEALRCGARVVGVIPNCLARGTREVAHTGLTGLEYVSDLMERKRRMMDLADAFVILPGGVGTLDEALDAITYKILDQHRKPIVFANLKSFWQSQLKVFEEMVQKGAVRSESLKLYKVCDSIESMWSYLDGEKS